jgi:multidrug transporter EmrE-like cation transporter
MGNLGWLLLIVLGIVGMESCAMTCLKNSKNGWHWFMAGVLFYVGVATLLAESLKLEGLAIVNALWSGISIMATTSIGVLYFKEILHFHDYIAVAMIGAGVVILKVTP